MERYLSDEMTEPVYEYEKYLGFDGVKRMAFRIPFACFDTTVLDETLTYVVRQDTDGWIRKYHKNSNLVEELKAPVEEEKDWYTLKDKVREHLELYCTDEISGRFMGNMRRPTKEAIFHCASGRRASSGCPVRCWERYCQARYLHCSELLLRPKFQA